MAVVRYSIETLLALNRPDSAPPAADEHARSVARALAAAMQRRSTSTTSTATTAATATRRRRRDGTAPAAPTPVGQPQASERIEAALRESPLGRALAEYRAQPDDPQLRALRDTVNAHLESLRRRGAAVPAAAAAAAAVAPRKPPKKPLLEEDRAPPLEVARDALPPLRAGTAPAPAPVPAAETTASSSSSSSSGSAEDAALFERLAEQLLGTGLVDSHVLVEQLLAGSTPPPAHSEARSSSGGTVPHAAPYRPPVPLQPQSQTPHTSPFELDWMAPPLQPATPAVHSPPRSPLRTPLHSTFVFSLPSSAACLLASPVSTPTHRDQLWLPPSSFLSSAPPDPTPQGTVPLVQYSPRR